MTNQLIPTKKRTVPDGACEIGTDGDGREHYHADAAKDHRVFVDTGDEVLVFDLGPTPFDVDDWVAHVDEWQRPLPYEQGLGALLVDGLEAH